MLARAEASRGNTARYVEPRATPSTSLGTPSTQRVPLVQFGTASATASPRPGATPGRNATATNVTSDANVPFVTATPVISQSGAGLLADLHAITDPLQGTYGIYIEDLNTGEHFGINDQHQFLAASVIKLPLAIALFIAEADGTVQLSTKITPRPELIRDFGTGSMRYDPPGTSYTIEDMLTRMIKQSDNTAAAVLDDVLGEDKVQQRVDGWQLTQTSVKDDMSSPADMGRLLRLLYKHKLISPKRTVDLLGLMTDTDFEDRIPQPLPRYVQVAHKIGTETHGVVNDVAIVVLAGHPYIICVMSDGTTSEEAVPAIRKISETVFLYEENLP
jgi:beta-lactamase class A